MLKPFSVLMKFYPNLSGSHSGLNSRLELLLYLDTTATLQRSDTSPCGQYSSLLHCDQTTHTMSRGGGILDTLVVCQTRYVIVLRVTNLKCKETDTFHSRIMFYVFTKQSICITKFLSVVAVLCSVSACSMSHDGCVPKMSQLRSKDAPVVF